MKKLCAVMLFVFVAMLAAGAAFAYDTKIIDEGTDLNNLHQSVRPIAHYGVDDNRGVYEDKSTTPSVWKYASVYYTTMRHGPRSIGVGYTVEDEYTNSLFFTTEGHRVGVSDGAAPTGYFSTKQQKLAIDGGKALNLQQAESTAVWRAIPMMTGTLMDLCGKYNYPVGQAWHNEANIATSLTKDTKAAVDGRINAWPYNGYSDKTYYTDGKTNRKTYKFWGDTWGIDRTPKAHPSGHGQYSNDPRYGYAVPRIEARNIAHALYGNPGTNVGTNDDPFTIGQETMTSVFVWSADRAWSTDKDMMGLGEAPDTVAVMVRLDNDLYKGMKVSDLNVIKVEANDGKWQGELTRVDSASQLRKNTFLVVHRSDENARDVVVNGDHIIQAGNRALAGSGGVCPTTATCDMEWRTMQYFVLLAVQKEDPWDVADPRPDYKDVVGGLHIVVAERPFTKTPNLCCSYPDGTEPRFGWVLGNRPNAEQRYDGFTRDPFLADAISGRPANFGYTSGYTQAFIDDVMGEPWNQMFFVKNEVVEAYGYADSIVYKLPAVRAGDVPAGKTALVMYTIRLGKGEMELDPENFVGKTPADIQVIDVRSAEKPEGDMTEFTRATDATQLTDGHFAILMPNPLARHEQVFVPEGHQFEADGIYFVALAVKDNGEFDLDQMKPLSNNQSWVSPAFLVIGGKKADPVLRVSPTSATVNVGDTQQFTASISDGSELPPVTWTSSDPAVATVDENGLATAVAAGAATITCAPEVGSGYAPVDVTLTVETPAPPSGGSSGGCSVGGFAPATLFLLAPLFLLLKK